MMKKIVTFVCEMVACQLHFYSTSIPTRLDCCILPSGSDAEGHYKQYEQSLEVPHSRCKQ